MKNKWTKLAALAIAALWSGPTVQAQAPHPERIYLSGTGIDNTKTWEFFCSGGQNSVVRMISFGGSNYNISFLIRKEDKNKALQSLSDHLFNNK